MKMNLVKKSRMMQEKAITLIALVVSIVVILLLAGVTIATLTGDNRHSISSTKCTGEKPNSKI